MIEGMAAVLDGEKPRAVANPEVYQEHLSADSCPD
jgi:hypothetical protein